MAIGPAPALESRGRETAFSVPFCTYCFNLYTVSETTFGLGLSSAIHYFAKTPMLNGTSISGRNICCAMSELTGILRPAYSVQLKSE